MRILNGTDLSVSPLCFGTCPISLTDREDDFFHLMDRFVQAGGNFIDTASVYGKWAPWFTNFSEQRVGRWLRSRGGHLVVATKGGHYNLSDPARTPRVNEAAVRTDLEDSLRALGVECIDFYWLHRDDPARPVGEILELMETLRREGKIRWYGASNYTAARLWEARSYAELHGLTGFSAVSDQWSLASVNPGANNNPDPTLALAGEAELEFHTRTGTPCIPYQSTARGWFAKTAAGERVAPDVTRAFDNAANRAVLAGLQKLSHESGVSVQALALTELTHRPFPVLPITSASNDAQMDTLLEALNLLDKE